jgi:hypothetical protein
MADQQIQESDARSEGQIFVWLGGEMRPVEPEKLADQLAPMVAHVMVPRSEAEAAELLALRLYDLMRDDDAEHMTDDDVESILRLREAHPRYSEETP